MATMELSNYLRLPVRAGTRLTQANMMCDQTHVDAPESTMYFQVLVDKLNQDILKNVANVTPTEAYLLAFIRGSVVRNRLESAQPYWLRIVELFELERLVKELKRQYGAYAVDEVIAKIKSTILSTLLRDRGRLGPAKFLFRIGKIHEEMFSPAMYGEVVELINAVSHWSQDDDASIRALFSATDLGEAHKSISKQLHLLLRRFELDAVVTQILTGFDQFVQIQKDANCLHPVLPIAEEAVGGIAEGFGVDADLARQLIYLFRFAWICRLEKVSDLSDFTPKSTVVIPQVDTTPTEAQRQAENTLMAVFHVLEQTLQSHADVQRFREQYPDVRMRSSAFVLSLPMPLFEVFLAAATGEGYLTFLTKYQMGQLYFQKYIEGLLHHLHYRTKMHELEAKYRGQLSTGLRPLLEQVMYLKTKIAKDGNIKHETILPLDASPRRTRQLLEKAIEHPDGGYVEQCGWLFNEIAKDDLVGHIRGIWTVTRG